MLPLISVVVPVYNVEKYINKCLDSVINQSYRNLEIILVEDCSKDSSYKIIKEYLEVDNRIKIINNNKNLGPSVSRNRGIEESKGEYITFIDSDDWVSKKHIENMYLEIIKKEDIDLIINDTILYYHEKRKKIKGNIGFKATVLSKNEVLENCDKISIFAWNKLYKNSIIKTNNLAFLDRLAYEDNYFNILYYLCCNNIIIINRESYFYTIAREKSITSNFSKYGKDIIVVFQKIAAILKKAQVNNLVMQAFYNLAIINIMRGARKKNNLNINYYKNSSDYLKTIDIQYISNKKALKLRKNYKCYFFKNKILTGVFLLASIKYLKVKIYSK